MPITRCTACRCPPRRTTTGTTGCPGPGGGGAPQPDRGGCGPRGRGPIGSEWGRSGWTSVSPHPHPHPDSLLCLLSPQSSEEGKRQAAVGPAIERAPWPLPLDPGGLSPLLPLRASRCASGPKQSGLWAGGRKGQTQGRGGRDRRKAEAPVVCGGGEGAGGGRKRTLILDRVPLPWPPTLFLPHVNPPPPWPLPAPHPWCDYFIC